MVLAAIDDHAVEIEKDGDVTPHETSRHCHERGVASVVRLEFTAGVRMALNSCAARATP